MKTMKKSKIKIDWSDIIAWTFFGIGAAAGYLS